MYDAEDLRMFYIKLDQMLLAVLIEKHFLVEDAENKCVHVL